MTTPQYSFKKLHERNGISTYYTKPSTIHEYDTPEEVLHDFNDILDHLGNNKWSWIIDSDGFELTLSLDMKTSRGFASLLSGKHAENLQEIRLINPTLCIRMILKLIMPFLPDSTRKKVKILSDRYYSLLEFL